MNVKVHNTIDRKYYYITIPGPESQELELHEKPNEICPSCNHLGQYMFFVNGQIQMLCLFCNMFYKIICE